MTTAPSSPSPATTSSAIIWNGKQPLWDFSEMAAYPVSIKQKKGHATAYVFLTPYSPDELKDILRKATAGYRREKRDVEIVREDNAIYAPLCDAHFVKLGNTTGTPSEHKAWLDKYSEFKPSFVEHTFGGLQMDPPKTAEDSSDILDISVELSGSIAVYQELYDPTTDKVVRVDMIHEYTHPTEAQYREYRGARRNKFLRKSTLWTITEQHGTLEKLYDAVIQKIDGAAAYGIPCTADTKNQWLSSVPLWHKLWIVDQIFGELVEKND